MTKPEHPDSDYTAVLIGAQALRDKSVEAIDESQQLMREIAATLKKAEASVAND